jgi:hypothetical protein
MQHSQQVKHANLSLPAFLVMHANAVERRSQCMFTQSSKASKASHSMVNRSNSGTKFLYHTYTEGLDEGPSALGA